MPENQEVAVCNPVWFVNCGKSVTCRLQRAVQQPQAVHSSSSHSAGLWLMRSEVSRAWQKETNLIWRCRYLWHVSSWPCRQHRRPRTGEEGSHTAPGLGTHQWSLCRRCPSLCTGWRRRLPLRWRCRYDPSQTCRDRRWRVSHMWTGIMYTVCV